MISDPHETGIRRDTYRKDQRLESYLIRLNRHLEFFPSGECEEGTFPLIYVVGLPRSGTTLLSQLISRYLPVGYINNLIARFWLNPVVGIRLSQAVFGPHIRENISLKSCYGVSPDPWGPHEFGYFWRHWLKLDEARTHKLPGDIMTRIDREGLRRALDMIAGAFEAPVVFKNIICGPQASFLSDVRPRSLFVLIERDPKAVAVSLLRSRKERYGDTSVWWSLKPSTFDDICCIKSAEEQVERQIVDGKRDLEEELAKSGTKSIRVSYESLCEDPVRCLEEIAGAVSLLGYPISLLGAPPQLTASKNVISSDRT